MNAAKLTIVEAVKSALKSRRRPMTVHEISQAIVAGGLYTFATKSVHHVIATQIRRHLEASPLADKAQKYFKAVGDKFDLIER